ncbi:shikimate kinase [Hansschlegelia zhihuaiae]|uniref:Shikimate kinase n=1 Tax=Hansschlegelia zhihuaiae TaxID=405005 RepID=A0A4Q0MBY0_9HYPH|nr:shikimate kinase [Hansschlegelia zhihuaiae]RXF70831.1 shikimate kinase [Hansschlegelia zhihuaiae]
MAGIQHLIEAPSRAETDAQTSRSGPEGDVAASVRRALGGRSIALVGMMGAGKTSVGRRLGQALSLPFVDADSEIEAAAGMTIPEIFETHGEPYFRSGEARIISRLLETGPQVLATGGGAWMNPETRARISESGVSVWLKADVEVLLRRVRKRGGRPLLASADPEATLRRLVEERYPTYALADIVITSRDAPHERTVAELIETLAAKLSGPAAGARRA